MNDTNPIVLCLAIMLSSYNKKTSSHYLVQGLAWTLTVLSFYHSGNESSNEIRSNALKMTSSINEILDAMRATNCGGLTFFNRIPGLPPLTFIGEKSYDSLILFTLFRFLFNWAFYLQNSGNPNSKHGRHPNPETLKKLDLLSAQL